MLRRSWPIALVALLGVAGCTSKPNCAGSRIEEKKTEHGRYAACIDEVGRYQGNATAVKQAPSGEIKTKGWYDADTPSEEWRCTRGSERLTLRFDAVAFRKKLWGLDKPPPGMKDGRHLGPVPTALCPDGDWSRFASGGFEVAPVGNLTDKGVVTVTEYVAPDGNKP